MKPTQAQVDNALYVAITENGYTELEELSPREVAIDLASFCPELDEFEVEVLEVLVKDWRVRKRYGAVQANPSGDKKRS